LSFGNPYVCGVIVVIRLIFVGFEQLKFRFRPVWWELDKAAGICKHKLTGDMHLEAWPH
jgi:hypothetical protein